uniref:hypothetical protein n=1 Tax=Polynucleobacter sp. TaxID=2029855 RepID=UPI0040475126
MFTQNSHEFHACRKNKQRYDHAGAIQDYKGCHSREILNAASKSHWNDTIPYTNNLQKPKKNMPSAQA